MSPSHPQISSVVPSLASDLNSTDGAGSTITNIVFGILALVVGMVTIWQAYRAYKIWHPAMSSTPNPRAHAIC